MALMRSNGQINAATCSWICASVKFTAVSRR
jgi:hypothetical protein